jgi:hypothetical protein
MLENLPATSAPSPGKAASSRSRRPRRERERYSGNSPEHYRVKALTEAFRAQLGDAALGPVTAAAITRAAELIALGEQVRGQRLRGEAVTVGDVVRIEGAARRAIRDLGIPAPGERDAGYVPLRERWAAEVEDGDETADEAVDGAEAAGDEVSATAPHHPPRKTNLGAALTRQTGFKMPTRMRHELHRAAGRTGRSR